MNNVTLLGRIGRQPETRITTSGKTVCSFSIAVRNPADDDKPEWVNIVCWEKTAELVTEHTGQGSRIVVEGRLQTRKWDDKEGNTRYRTEVVANRIHFAGPKPANNAGTASSNGGEAEPNFAPVDLGEPDAVYGDEEPF